MKLRKGSVLILSGVLLVAAALALVLYNVWDAKRAETESGRILTEMLVLIPAEPVIGSAEPEQQAYVPHVRPGGAGTLATDPEADETTGTEAPEEMTTVRIEDWDYIGVLELPTLGLTLPVMSEWDYNRLRTSPCRYYGSARGRNLVICAHNYPFHFSPIRSIQPGAEVILTDMDGVVFRYEVAYTETMQPTQVSEMVQSDGQWDLTLFTCNIGGSTRFAVRCVLQPDDQ